MLPYAALQAAQQGDPNRRNSNLTGGPPWWGRSAAWWRQAPLRQVSVRSFPLFSL